MYAVNVLVFRMTDNKQLTRTVNLVCLLHSVTWALGLRLASGWTVTEGHCIEHLVFVNMRDFCFLTLFSVNWKQRAVECGIKSVDFSFRWTQTPVPKPVCLSLAGDGASCLPSQPACATCGHSGPSSVRQRQGDWSSAFLSVTVGPARPPPWVWAGLLCGLRSIHGLIVRDSASYAWCVCPGISTG